MSTMSFPAPNTEQYKSNMKESGFLVVVGRGKSRRLGSHGQEIVTEEDHLGKEVTTDEGISISQLLAAGDRIKVKLSCFFFLIFSSSSFFLFFHFTSLHPSCLKRHM